MPPHDPPLHSLTIPAELHEERLDKVVGHVLAHLGLSRERHKRLIHEGCVTLDRKEARKPSLRVARGQKLRIEIAGAELAGRTPAAVAGDLVIVHQDPDFLVLNKPAGLTVHPAPGITEATLVNRLLHRFPQLAEPGNERPGIVHRLDKDTSGLLLVALNEPARLTLSRDFAERSVDKRYLAIVHGVPEPGQGVIDLPLGRDPASKVRMAVVKKGGREARTGFETLFADPAGRFSLLAVKLFTGRTHQIRVHLSHLGHPLFGDSVYRGPKTSDPLLAKLAKRQMLHAWSLSFNHPAGGQAGSLHFVQPPPKDFVQVLLHLCRTLQRVALTGMPGCGKSALLKLLADQGTAAASADRMVAELYEPGQDGFTFLSKRFGERFVSGGRIHKGALFQAMRESRELRREVEQAVHPMVWHRVQEFWAAHQSERMAVVEIPLLVESGPDLRRAAADIAVAVHCPRPERLKRLQASRGWDNAMLAAMESWQWAEADKLRACDLVVDNSGSPADLERSARALLRALAGLRRARIKRLHDEFQALMNRS